MQGNREKCADLLSKQLSKARIITLNKSFCNFFNKTLTNFMQGQLPASTCEAVNPSGHL